MILPAQDPNIELLSKKVNEPVWQYGCINVQYTFIIFQGVFHINSMPEICQHLLFMPLHQYFETV